ncbi:hypothetical protein H8S20_07465 [Clostridium sp. NSJ-6]|uniref:Uncharacterized protein n=1 Tax=Clostridium hominis TaxID=2763036 RepID=A0ABR7DBE0_9CLOT|nr:hypothetical protein [Clostridium hominis]MBC5628725.1 hypothetical protein [Clostridium hominis]
MKRGSFLKICVASGIKEVLLITVINNKCIEYYSDRSVEFEIELERSDKQQMLEMIKKTSI